MENLETKSVMHYFGTDLDTHGHYFWILDGDRISKSKIWFRDLPFNPEELTQDANKNSLPRGEVRFYNLKDYTILAISGSPKDTRNGTKSVFWLNEKMNDAEMKSKVLEIPIAKKIIDTMPFEIKWEL